MTVTPRKDALLADNTRTMAQRWSNETAWDWYNAQGWKMGANFLPSTASNQLEMWQQFYWPTQEKVIERELGWASQMGYNAMRVFLHNLVYENEGQEAYLNRIERFLEISSSHGIRIMFVFFDSCWDPYPVYGKQPEPRPFIHNSRWAQSPGRAILENPSNYTSLKPYIQSVLRRFGNDTRVLLWDLFNEADNPNTNSYGYSNLTRVPAASDTNATDLLPQDKIKYSVALLNQTFSWAREVGPIQTPLTAPVWGNNDKIMEKLILENVDVISFHNYAHVSGLANQTQYLLDTYDRPVVCSEYMARPIGSTFDPNLGYLKNMSVFAFNWGLVAGRSQTKYPWDSWVSEYNETSLNVWFHDVLQQDGTPFNETEYLYIHDMIKTSGITWDLFRNVQWWWLVLPAVLACLVVVRLFKMVRRRRRSASHNYHSGAQTMTEQDLTDNDLELI